MSRALRGVNREEISRFLAKPRPFSVRVKGMGEENIEDVIVKMQIAILHELNVVVLSGRHHVQVISFKQNGKGVAKATVLLTEGAWAEAFNALATEAWQKRYKAHTALKKRRAERRKQHPGSSKKRNKYRNVLIRFIYDGNKLMARAAGGLNPRWNVSFPKHLREAGAQYVVEKIEVAKGFYRAKGKIIRVV
jgi:hypothetical protein